MIAKCRWVQNEDGTWETACGNAYEIVEGTPRDNKMRYCCYCGGQLLFTSHAWILRRR